MSLPYTINMARVQGANHVTNFVHCDRDGKVATAVYGAANHGQFRGISLVNLKSRDSVGPRLIFP